MGREKPETRRAREQKRYANDSEYREKLKAKRAAYYQANKERAKQRTREYRRLNPYMQWGANLKRYEGMSIEIWWQMLAAQSGRCAICNDPMVKPCVDHDHETGAVRGLLCEGCNHGLGKFRDCADLLARAIVYLK